MVVRGIVDVMLVVIVVVGGEELYGELGRFSTCAVMREVASGVRDRLSSLSLSRRDAVVGRSVCAGRVLSRRGRLGVFAMVSGEPRAARLGRRRPFHAASIRK